MCAEDIPLERLPTVLVPTGKFWDGLEIMWANLVHEIPDIPDGATEFFLAYVKPILGEGCMLCSKLQTTLVLCRQCMHIVLLVCCPP